VGFGHCRKRVRPDLHRPSPTPDQRLATSRVGQDSSSAGTPPACGRRNDRQTSHRGCPTTPVSGVLLPYVPRSEEKRKNETSYQPSNSQPLPRHTFIQNGNSRFDIGCSLPGRLGHLPRLDGRILPCPNSSQISEVSQIRHQQQSLPVQSSSIWSRYSTSCLHQDASAVNVLPSPDGNSFPQVHRRSSPQSKDIAHTVPVVNHSHSIPVSPGLQDQLTKVNVDSLSRLCLRRGQVHYLSRGHVTPPREDCQDRLNYPVYSNPRPSSSLPMAVPSRSSGFGRETGTDGQTIPQTSSDLPAFPVSPWSTSTHTPCITELPLPNIPRLVVRHIQPHSRPTVRSVQARSDLVHGRLYDSMGSTLRGPSVLRLLDHDREVMVHQPPGTSHSTQSTTASAPVVVREEHHDCHGQFVHGGIHQQIRGHQISSHVIHHLGPVPLGDNTSNLAQSTSHSRSSQPNGRHLEQKEPNCGNRVDSARSDLPPSLVPMGIPVHRPDGDVHVDSSASLHISLSGSESTCGRRNVLQLDRSGRVYLSTVAHDSSGPPEDTTRTVPDHSHLATVAEPALVSRPSKSLSRPTKTTTSLPRSSQNASQSSFTRKSASVESSRVQAIIDSYVEQGFSLAVAKRLARGKLKNSSIVIYDSRWDKFSGWCDQQDVDPRRASLGILADFLVYLFNDLRLSYQAIAGYRTSINSVWRARGRHDADAYPITQLVKNFKAERPRAIRTTPKWDLALVLHLLSHPPYEPLEEISFARLTYKTVFLLLLASARRRGDIHAIDPERVTFRTDGKAVILETVPNYVPKVRANAEGHERYMPIVIRALSSYATEPADLALCPVRTLRAYHRRAAARVKDRKRFFISTRADRRYVHKNTISAWVVKLIRAAYARATEDQCRLYRTSTHEVRAIAASLAYQATHSLDAVLSAATWANSTTFTSYYLRDVSGLRGNLHVIGPCIVAGTALH